MSRHVRRRATLVALSALVWLGRPAGAQTIGDYSRAQRSVLENTMTQAAARSAGVGASAPALPASSVASPTPLVPRGNLPASAPAMQVSGVFASSSDSVAEVVVNATAYLLGAGQGVPGTSWRVESVAIDRVVLSRRDAGAAIVDPDGARKVFALPALR
jgi:hypothetical protein